MLAWHHMAKLKPVGSRRPAPARSNVRGALPCLVIVLGASALFAFLFYAALKGS